MADGIRIDELPPTATPSLDHQLAAMKDGITARISIQQIASIVTSDLGSAYVAKAGDSMSGDLSIDKAGASAYFTLNKAVGGFAAVLRGVRAGVARWVMNLGNATLESSGNIGSDFSLERYNDAGTFVDTPFSINRASGIVNMGLGATTLAPALGDNTARVITAAFLRTNAVTLSGLSTMAAAHFVKQPLAAETAAGAFTPSTSGSHGNLRQITASGAVTLNAPGTSSDCFTMVALLYNSAAATITPAGFNKVSGDALPTSAGGISFIYITRIQAFVSLYVEKLAGTLLRDEIQDELEGGVDTGETHPILPNIDQELPDEPNPTPLRRKRKVN